MSLKTKFALMLGVIALSVSTMLGISLWSYSLLDREVSGALFNMQSVLDRLSNIKRRSWEQAELLDASSFPMAGAPSELGHTDPVGEETRVAFTDLAEQIDRELAGLGAIDSYYLRFGSRTRALGEGARTVFDEAMAYLDEGDEAALGRAAVELYRQHERIESLEREVIAMAEHAIGYGSRLRGLVTTGLVSSTLLVVLAGVLGTLLVRRLVLAPVEALRVAAARIGAGDYGHRIQLRGNDEMATLAGEMDEMAGLIGQMQDERIERERLAAVGEMVQRIVHNIRGPLGGIRGVVEVADRNADRVDLVRESMARVKGTIDRFDIWVNEMLQVTRPADVKPREQRVRPWLQSLVESHRDAATSAGVILELDAAAGPESASFDSHHLEQALVGVISNAIQASPASGQVFVRAHDGSEAGTWVIEVEDTGPGIRPEDLGRIFRPYFTTKTDGNGIGLAHARQIIERHGGRIWAENVEKADSDANEVCGARFLIELPVKCSSSDDE